MCGRFSQNLGRHQRAIIFFRNRADLALPARYNIAPTQYVPVFRQEIAGSEPEVRDLYWGLVPSWAKRMAMGSMSINARCETLAEKTTFREAFKKRRCIVPASGFYEWKVGPDKKTRIPYYFTSANEDDGLGLAGLWERWDKHGEEILSFSIITTEANALVSDVHHRMPVILPPESWAAWLDPGNTDRGGLSDLMQPAADGVLQYWQVSQYVNNPRNEGEECIRRVS